MLPAHLPGTECYLPTCQALSAECSSCHYERQLTMSLSLPYSRNRRYWAVTFHVYRVLPLFEEGHHVRRVTGLRAPSQEPAVVKDTQKNLMTPPLTGVLGGQRLCHQGLPPCPLIKYLLWLSRSEGLFDLLPRCDVCGSYKASMIHDWFSGVLISFATADLSALLNKS